MLLLKYEVIHVYPILRNPKTRHAIPSLEAFAFNQCDKHDWAPA